MENICNTQYTNLCYIYVTSLENVAVKVAVNVFSNLLFYYVTLRKT